jgi:hypothetical protein
MPEFKMREVAAGPTKKPHCYNYNRDGHYQASCSNPQLCCNCKKELKVTKRWIAQWKKGIISGFVALECHDKNSIVY